MSENPFEGNAPYKLTLKAGKGFEDPWLTIEAGTVEVLHDRLKSVNESALFALIGTTSKTLQAAYVNGKVLGAEAINPPTEPEKSEADEKKAPAKKAPAKRKTAAQKKAEAEAAEASESAEEESEAPEAPEEAEKPAEEAPAPAKKARPTPKWKR